MKKILTTLTTAGMLTAIVMVQPVATFADEGTQEKTECTTGAYGQQTCVTKKVECTTGAYGQQNCKTVTEQKDDRVLGEKKHTPVDSGIAENIMFAVAGLTLVSGASYVFNKRA